jgi:hypothetical protein
MRAERQNVDQRVAQIESMQQLANVVVLTARKDEKLNAIERRVDRIGDRDGSRSGDNRHHIGHSSHRRRLSARRAASAMTRSVGCWALLFHFSLSQRKPRYLAGSNKVGSE